MAKKKSGKKGASKKSKKANVESAPKKTKEVDPVVVEETPVLAMAVGAKKSANVVATTLALSAIAEVDELKTRTDVGDIETLTDSIKKQGLIHPLTVAPGDEEGQYVLVCGYRRIAAINVLGWASVAVIVRPDLAITDSATLANALAFAASENSDDARTNLNALEFGYVCSRLKDEGWSPAKIAKAVGANHMRVRRCLALVEAPEDVQDKVVAGQIGLVGGLELAKLDPEVREVVNAQINETENHVGSAFIKRLAKSAAKDLNATEDGEDGGEAGTIKKKGKKRDASMTTYRGAKAKAEMLEQLCFYFHNSSEDDEGTQGWHELRGSIGALLWDRDDISDPVLPAIDDEDDKKALKKFNTLVKAYAKKHVPKDVEEEGEEL